MPEDLVEIIRCFVLTHKEEIENEENDFGELQEILAFFEPMFKG